jgi:hypothetical protein
MGPIVARWGAAQEGEQPNVREDVMNKSVVDKPIEESVINLAERRASRVTRRFSKRLAHDFFDELAATDPELASIKTKAMAHYVPMESSRLVRIMRQRATLTQKELSAALRIAQSRIAY